LIGEELKRLRREKKMTQDGLGKKIGKDKYFICRLEKKHSVKRKLINKIAVALNLGKQERMKLEISSGFLPNEMKDHLSDKKFIKILARLVDPKLSEKDKQTLKEDIIAVYRFVAKVITLDV